MRRPLIFFLLLLSIYCWFTDIMHFILYVLHISGSNKSVAIHIAALLLLAAVVLFIKKSVFKNQPFPRAGALFAGGTKIEWLLLFVVSSPIILLGLLRSVYPDQNYDTFHFELYLQEYDVKENAVNFGAAGIRSYYFPLAERCFALFRHLLGFRLGTFLNTILLVTIIFSVYDFIRKACAAYWPQRAFPAVPVAILALFAVFADNTLFNIGSYKPDLIGIPFLLELAHLVFFPAKNDNKKLQPVYFFLVASLTIAFKLTYLPYTAVFGLLYWLSNFKVWSYKKLFTLPLLVLVFPIIYMLYNMVETGNPIFPFYNKLFHSVQYPLENFKDTRWGPRAFYETFIYPIVIFLDKSRCNEWQLFSYRLLAGYFIVITNIAAYFITFRKSKANLFFRCMVGLAAIALLFDLLCVVTTGYYRYGIIVEVLYGVIISMWYLYFSRAIVSFFLFMIMILQCYTTFHNIFVKQLNLSWHDYKDLLQNRTLLRNNAGLLFRDRGHIADPDSILPKINGFVNVDPFPEDGLAKLLKKNVPVINLELAARTPALTTEFEKNIIRPKTGKETWVSVASIEALNVSVLESLNRRGFIVSAIHEVYPDFVKYGEPIFLLQVQYLDTSRFTIKTTQQYLRDENPPETRNHFSYQTGHPLTAFIREAPYTYYWDFLPAQYEITVNDKKYAINNQPLKSKIIPVEGNGLTIHKPNSTPYLIIVQEIIEK